jgi:hypothetical protein
MEASNITSNNTATRIMEGMNCTLISPDEGLDWDAADFYTMVSYRCDFDQRSMVPATLTFTGNTNITCGLARGGWATQQLGGVLLQ